MQHPVRDVERDILTDLNPLSTPTIIDPAVEGRRQNDLACCVQVCPSLSAGQTLFLALTVVAD